MILSVRCASTVLQILSGSSDFKRKIQQHPKPEGNSGRTDQAMYLEETEPRSNRAAEICRCSFIWIAFPERQLLRKLSFFLGSPAVKTFVGR